MFRIVRNGKTIFKFGKNLKVFEVNMCHVMPKSLAVNVDKAKILTMIFFR